MKHWWEGYPWRMIQTNLRQIDMADINAKVYAKQLKDFGATVVTLNAAGIIANVLNVELEVPVSEQGPGMGGAMLAMVACGEYPNIKSCCDKLCAVADVVKPKPELVAKYEARYQQFKKIYPAVKNLFPEIQ